MHTQHVKSFVYVGGGGVGGVVAVVLVFEEGKLSGLEEDDDRSSVFEVVVVVVSFLPLPRFFFLLLLFLLDFFMAQILRVERSFVFGVINRQIGWVLCVINFGSRSLEVLESKLEAPPNRWLIVETGKCQRHPS